MNENITPLPWGIERSRDKLWIGPLKEDGAKVREIVVSFDIGPAYTTEFNTRQISDAAYVLKAANAYPALTARVKELEALVVDVASLMREMSTQSEPGAAARLYFDASEQMFWRVETTLAKNPSVRAATALNKEPT